MVLEELGVSIEVYAKEKHFFWRLLQGDENFSVWTGENIALCYVFWLVVLFIWRGPDDSPHGSRR
jgi:hypothetical protein